MSIEEDIIDIVKYHSFHRPIGRKELHERISCSDRAMRACISHIADIGEAGEEYFWKKCERDFDIHDRFIKSRMKESSDRLERNKQRRLDRQHEPGFIREVSDMVHSWQTYSGEVHW